MRSALLATWITMAACLPPDDAADTATEADADTDADSDTDTDSDTDADTDTDLAPLSYLDDVYLPHLKDACGECHVEVGYIHPPITEDPGFLIGELSSTGMAYVTPGAPDDSFLWLKVNDRQGADAGTRMPPERADALSPAALAAVEAWIRTGAER